jgi:hypothetical protein
MKLQLRVCAYHISLDSTFQFGLARSRRGLQHDFDGHSLQIILHYAGRLPAKMVLSITRYVVLLYICSLVSIALAAHSSGRSSYAVKETHHVPGKWTRVGPAPAWHTIRLQIGLKQGLFVELERHLYEGNSNVPILRLRIGHVLSKLSLHLQFLERKLSKSSVGSDAYSIRPAS